MIMSNKTNTIRSCLSMFIWLL